MPPKPEKRVPTEVVEIGSSDDEDDVAVVAAKLPQKTPQSQPQPQPQRSFTPVPRAPGYRGLDCRNFWKAGGSDVVPVVRKPPASAELEHARVHPKFLHSNATSHKWAFGAIAELLDNAVDEIQNGATFVRVDKVEISKDKSPALLFLDDGGGMNPEGIRKCMSLGYSSKKSKTTIGQYGNGFKTSTMRLGADVIVFSRATSAGYGYMTVLRSLTTVSKDLGKYLLLHWVLEIIFNETARLLQKAGGKKEQLRKFWCLLIGFLVFNNISTLMFEYIFFSKATQSVGHKRSMSYIHWVLEIIFNETARLLQKAGGKKEQLRKFWCLLIGFLVFNNISTLMFEYVFFSKATQSVGLLSYTFLRRTSQDDVVVPMIDFDISGHWAEPIILSSQDDWSSNLKTILEWSPFTSKEELLEQFEGIGRHGTKILIYNLWLNDEGVYELSFDDDDEDIRLRDEVNRGGQAKLHKRAIELQSHVSYRLRFSLRAYASVLYLRKFTDFKIVLRGKPVEQYHIAKHLLSPKKVIYKPQMRTYMNEAVVEATLGYIPEAPFPVSGFNVYHKNRLIRPYWKVTAEGSSKGNGVVGVLEANFIEPAHDKQDFERSSVFIRLETKLKQILMEYWNAHCHLFGYQSPTERMMKYYAKTQKPQPTNQLDTDLSSSSAHEMNLNPPLQHPRYNQVGNSGPIRLRAELPVTGIGSETGDQVIVNDPGSGSVEALCEENIQLFMRCEEQRLQEIELKQKVEELEKQVEQAKRKCAQLAAHLETRRKQQTPQVL